MSKVEVNPTSETTDNTEQAATEVENGPSRFKGAAIRVFQNGKTVAERWSSQSVRAAGDLAGSARERIKNDPIRTAAISFAIGMTLGALISRYASRHQI
jgi:ElaB/YqjD/DUF883 family membrane-anchored ribosome-binding protein